MTEEEKQNWIKKYGGWIAFLILLAFLVGIIYGPKLVKASPIWPLNKNQTCEMLNYSEADCDSYWCNNFISNDSQNCTYDLSLSMCNCRQIVNIVNLTNSTNINPINCSDTNITFAIWIANCNKTINCFDSNISVANYNLYCLNNTNVTNVTILEGFNQTEMIQFRNMIFDYVDNKSYGNSNYSGYYGYQPAAPWPWQAWILIAFVFSGTIIFLSIWSVYSAKTKGKERALPFKRVFDNSKFNPIEIKKEESKKEEISDEPDEHEES